MSYLSAVMWSLGFEGRLLTVWLSVLAAVAGSGCVSAQSNVRAWHAAGQVFVVWRVDATLPLTYDVYRSAAPITATSQGILAGRVFEPEWTGARLEIVKETATWVVPVPNGGTYQLAANEGLFVHTPRAAGSEYFSVVRGGVTSVASTNTTTAAVQVGYDPVNDPVSCHLQVRDVTSRGYPFRTYAMWVDGNDDPNNSRPDFPVMANAAKRGAPHVFSVFEPMAGLPNSPYPAVVCLHGGGPSGSHWAWAPESIHYANDEATPVHGITIAMDDRVFVSTNGVVSLDRPSNWFGWHPGMDPVANVLPSNTAVVVPYTLRRLVWTLDWLQTRSPYAIDSQRTAVMGNSMGGAGTLLLSRFRPERFSAATAFVPQHYTPDTGQRLFGTPAQNLATTELGPNGIPLRVNDFFDAAVRLSPQQRDFCLTRIFRGRRDQAVDWGALTIQLFNDMTAARWGTHLYWDNRDHTASDWTTDDPTTPWVDIGEWVAPVTTSRSGAPYQARYRARQSYPGFHGEDQQPNTAGRQPTLGNGSPDDGTPWGTWGGYFDWDTETIFDLPTGWACTMFLIGRSSVGVDNFPGTTATTNLTVRMPRRLLPAPGALLAWELRDDRSDLVLQSGTVAAESNGLVAITGLVIPRDPQRVRLEVRVGSAPRPGDLDADGTIGTADLDLIRLAPVDLDGDGLANAADERMLERHVLRQNAVAAATAPYGKGCYAESRGMYEFFSPAAFDLASSSMRLSLGLSGNYVASAAGSYVPPSASATILPLADDGAVSVTLSGPLSYPGGVTSTLEVCSNGFVSAGSGNGTSPTPTIASWLASPRARWGCWHDFHPAAAGSGRVKFEQVGSMAYVTWDGVFSYGTTRPATFQLQFDRATGTVTFAWGPVTTGGNSWLVGFAAPGPNVDTGSRDLSVRLPGAFSLGVNEVAPPTLAASRPRIGDTIVFTTTSLPAAATAGIQVLDTLRIDPGIELSGVGMPRCFQYVGLAVAHFVPVASGTAMLSLPVPNDVVLMGLPIHGQTAVFAPGANPAGITTSNGLTLILGL